MVLPRNWEVRLNGCPKGTTVSREVTVRVKAAYDRIQPLIETKYDHISWFHIKAACRKCWTPTSEDRWGRETCDACGKMDEAQDR